MGARCRWDWVERLRVHQAVILSLDDVPDTIQCRVLDVQGAVSRLSYQDELPPRTVGRLVLGSPGYVVFDEYRIAVGLRVAVRASPPYLDIAIVDGVSVPERRGGERVKLVTRGRIVVPTEEPAEQPVQWTYTVDISESGVLLRKHPAIEDAERFRLELMFGDDPNPIVAEAEVVRRTADAVGVRFESMSADDGKRLSSYLMGIRHQRRSASRN
jgi:hypothetical protein